MSFRSMKLKDALFKFYFHFLELQSPKTAFHEAIDSKSPTIVGVNKAIHDIIIIHLDRVEKDVETFLKTDNEKLEGASEVHSKDISIENSDDVHLLYAVSGSGKTRRIERLLHSQWGYYLLPGNVNPTEQRNCGNLYDPQREEYSKDSCVLWMLLREIDKILLGTEINQLQIRNWFDRLILSRHLIFDRFLKVAAKRQAMIPAKWLGFQKSCSISDPFETLFKLLLLVNSGSKDLGYETTDLDRVLKGNAFYYCLDEAQCCLDTPLPFSHIGRYKDENILQLICGQILLTFKADDRFQNPGLRFIVGGTSLKLKETVSIIEGTQEWREPDEDIVSAKCETVTDFPLLTSAQDLLNLIKERGLFQKIDSYSDIADKVEKCGIPLRGRYLWSALYVDHLKEHFEKHGNLDKKAISEAANKIIDKAKISLKERLSQLQEKKHNEILQELCWVVIQSDLLDMPTKFEKDEDHQMISEAFAVVETEEEGSPVGVLKERLAVEAATEWFREKQWDMYSGKLKEYLRFSTNDASSFGKAAEWWLVLELWHCLHHSKRVTGSEGEVRRRQILETLSKASIDGREPKKSEHRPGLRSSSSKPLDLASTHRLVEGKNIGHMYDGKTSRGYNSRGETPNLDHAVPIWKWMESIRNCETPVASFYFPDTLAGPDILFALEPKESASIGSSFGGRILCILQLKTGPIRNMKDAINTTNLLMSYQGPNTNQTRDDQKGKLGEELKNWKDAMIIRVLVCTARNYKDNAVATCLRSEGKTSDNEFFFLCDKEHTGDLFGETFASLAEARMTPNSGATLFESLIKKRGRDEEDAETNRKRTKN